MLKKYILWILFFFCLGGETTLAQEVQKYEFSKKEMGTLFRIVIYSKDSLKAVHAASKAFREINRLNKIYSDYIDSSQLNKLSRSSGQGIYFKVSPELFDIIQMSLDASQMSEGAFDITIGPLVKVWRWAFKNRIMPNKELIERAKKAVGYEYIRLDTIDQSIRLLKPDMHLDLGGIAKGYAVQEAMKIIRRQGISVAMVNGGGDIVLSSPPPNRTGWHMGIEFPESKDSLVNKILFLKNEAIATSGDIYQHLDWKGSRYSHIVDPRTGYGITNERNVTIIANDGATADWLASACSILSLKEAKKLTKMIPNVSMLILERRNGKIYQTTSGNFDQFFKK